MAAVRVLNTRLAAAYTVVQSARRTGIPVRDYLIDIIGRLARGWPARQLTGLLPTRWSSCAVTRGPPLWNAGTLTP